MNQTLHDEIKQVKPFVSVKEELWLNLSRTTAAVSHELESRLRPHGLSLTQYNVLRILRGAEAGLCQHEIRDRLVAQVPDVPRILERMEKTGTIRRTRGSADRRMVIATLTMAGRQLVDELDVPMMGWMDGLFKRLNGAELEAMIDGLVRARQ